MCWRDARALMAFRFVVRSGLAQSMTASPAHHADTARSQTRLAGLWKMSHRSRPKTFWDSPHHTPNQRLRSIRAGPPKKTWFRLAAVIAATRAVHLQLAKAGRPRRPVRRPRDWQVLVGGGCFPRLLVPPKQRPCPTSAESISYRRGSGWLALGVLSGREAVCLCMLRIRHQLPRRDSASSRLALRRPLRPGTRCERWHR